MSVGLRTEAVAARFGFPSVRAAYKWLRAHGIPSDKLGPRLRLWDVASIQKLIEKRAA